MNLRDKNVWITGASSGIGAASALEFAKQGANVILSARREAALLQVKADCEKLGVKAWVFPLDLSQTEAIAELVERVIGQVGTIDILLNNGGISQRGEVKETILAVDRRIMEVNFFGTVALTKAVLPFMLKNGGGQIAVTSSVVGKLGFPLRSAYAASKHALHGFFESMRIELVKDNVGVTLICPGRIHTPISQSALNGDGSTWGKVDEGQATGMPVEVCAAKMVRAIRLGKKEVYIGWKEALLIYIRRFFPALFYWLVGRVKAT